MPGLSLLLRLERFDGGGAAVPAADDTFDEWSESLGGGMDASGDGEPDDFEAEVDGTERRLERRGSLGDGGAIAVDADEDY